MRVSDEPAEGTSKGGDAFRQFRVQPLTARNQKEELSNEKEDAYIALVVVLALAATASLVWAGGGGGNKGKDRGNGWVNYGNIRVTWSIADCDSDTIDDGYQYWWEQDRNLNGIYNEGDVQVDYGRFGGVVWRNEGTAPEDFGCDVGFDYFTDKVIHLTEGWVAGVTVPGGVSRFVVKDNDGDGIYTGGDSAVLFWDGVTQQGDPPGPYNIQNKFEYTFNATGLGGLVVDGHYIQKQYMMIPDGQ